MDKVTDDWVVCLLNTLLPSDVRGLPGNRLEWNADLEAFSTPQATLYTLRGAREQESVLRATVRIHKAHELTVRPACPLSVATHRVMDEQTKRQIAVEILEEIQPVVAVDGSTDDDIQTIVDVIDNTIDQRLKEEAQNAIINSNSRPTN